jgi:hypothetical protein
MLRRAALAFALAAAAAFSAAPPADSASATPKKGKPMAAAPLELRLMTASGPGLRAELANLSAKPQPYLHDGFHQPCQLILKTAAGKSLPAFDSRRIQKRSNALEEDMYATVDPGDEDTLQEAEFMPEDGTWSLAWGPFRWEHLKPGAYAATAVWKSAKDEWTDSETEKSGRIKGLWKGTLKSKELRFELPAAAP